MDVVVLLREVGRGISDLALGEEHLIVPTIYGWK